MGLRQDIKQIEKLKEQLDRGWKKKTIWRKERKFYFSEGEIKRMRINLRYLKKKHGRYIVMNKPKNHKPQMNQAAVNNLSNAQNDMLKKMGLQIERVPERKENDFQFMLKYITSWFKRLFSKVAV